MKEGMGEMGRWGMREVYKVGMGGGGREEVLGRGVKVMDVSASWMWKEKKVGKILWCLEVV